MKCANCQKEFDPADRAAPTANQGSMAQIRYCSYKCKRSKNNALYYRRKLARRAQPPTKP